MAKSKLNEETPSMTFEQAMMLLEQIVKKLESGSLPLEDMLAEYAKAVEAIQICHGQLDGARRRIAQLQSVREDGTAMVKEWEDTAPSARTEGKEAPSRRRNPS
jgi:exodeoxyribonuclease VII small subunit